MVGSEQIRSAVREEVRSETVSTVVEADGLAEVNEGQFGVKCGPARAVTWGWLRKNRTRVHKLLHGGPASAGRGRAAATSSVTSTKGDQLAAACARHTH